MNVTAETLQEFFQRFVEIKNLLGEEIYQDFQNDFSTLKSGLEPLFVARAKEELEEAYRFNLFKLFGIGTKEVTTHSVLLAELLNPAGVHGQGSLFLNGFFEMLKSENPPNIMLPKETDETDWRVRRELVTHEGNLDLVLSSRKAKWILVIENKINAGDQKDQLERYSRWLESQRDHFEFRSLAYLTLNGRPSNEAKEVIYACLSYRKEIQQWLESTFPHIRADVTRVVINQYLNLIQTL